MTKSEIGTANLDIINQALARMGSSPVTTYPDTSNAAGRVFSGIYLPTIREVLRIQPWGSAITQAPFESQARASAASDDYQMEASIPATCIRILDLNGDRELGFRIEGSKLFHDIDAEGAFWEDTTAYALEDLVIGYSSGTANVYECTTAGTSHATTEPTWPSSSTVTDGTVTWTYVGAYGLLVRYVQMAVASDDATFPDPTGWDPLLLEAVVTRLASKAAHPLTGKPEIGRALYQEYLLAVGTAKGIPDENEVTGLTPWTEA